MKSFYYAARGIFRCIQSEQHMRFHLCAAFYVIIAGFVTKLTLTEWIAALLCIAEVPALELVNTAVEKLSDAVTREYSPLIERAKDCAAGAVLWASVVSAAVGLVLFCSNGRPRLAVESAAAHPLCTAALLLTVPAAIWFVLRKN